MTSRRVGAFSQRETVGWEQRSVPLSGNPSAGQLEARVGAQVVEIVGILVAASDGQHACTQDIGHAVRHQQRIAWISDQRGKPVGDPNRLLHLGEQHHAAI